ARLVAMTASMVGGYGGMVSHKGTDLPSRALNHHSSRQAPTPYREDCEAGELAHTGLNQQMLAQRTWRRDVSTRFTINSAAATIGSWRINIGTVPACP
ncbi:hypothetical protein BHM03_00032871, partial [Ensete ventricosum]